MPSLATRQQADELNAKMVRMRRTSPAIGNKLLAVNEIFQAILSEPGSDVSKTCQIVDNFGFLAEIG